MGEGSVCMKKVIAEFVGMTLFVYIGCGTAVLNSPAGGVMAWRLEVALAFGLSIATLVYAIAHVSGGELNWAVTLGLVVAGKQCPKQGAANALGQLFGAVLGAALLEGTLDTETNLGSNLVGDNVNVGQAFLGEFLMSFLLVFVVLQTACQDGSVGKGAGATFPLAIGLAVVLAHFVLLPLTGCSINPPRSFGPALVATIAGQKNLFDDYWVFLVAPCLGGACAGLYNKYVACSQAYEVEEEKTGASV